MIYQLIRDVSWSKDVLLSQLRRQDFSSGRGDIIGGRPRRRSGRRSPPDARKIWKFPKILKKIAKNGLFLPIMQKIKNPALDFRALDEYLNCVANVWENFQRFLWKKAQKRNYFSLF